MDLGRLATLRQALYRVLAAGYDVPDERLQAAGPAALEALDELGLFEHPFAPWAARYLETLASADLAAMEARRVALFEAGVKGAACSPLESAWRPSAGRDDTAVVQGELERLYRRAGLKVASSGTYTPDHLVVELEVMSALCGREASTRTGTGDVAPPVADQRALLEEHLGVWVPDFTRRLEQVGGLPVYEALAKATRAFVGHDLDLLRYLRRETGSR